MGFGYLTIGYLVSFVFEITVERIGTLINFEGLGIFVMILGGLLMLKAIRMLCNYERSFITAYFVTLFFIVENCVRALCALDVAFGWNGFLSHITMNTVMEWIHFAAFLVLHFAILASARMLSLKVDLKVLASSALYGDFLVGLYALFFILGKTPVGNIQGWYLYTLLILLGTILFNMILFFRCTKNIIPAEEEEPKKKKGFFGKMNDTLNEKENAAIEKAQKETLDFFQKREEQRQSKKKK